MKTFMEREKPKKKGSILTSILLWAYGISVLLAIYTYFNSEDFTVEHVAFMNLMGWICAFIIASTMRTMEGSARLLEEIHEIELEIEKRKH